MDSPSVLFHIYKVEVSITASQLRIGTIISSSFTGLSFCQLNGSALSIVGSEAKSPVDGFMIYDYVHEIT